MWLSPASRRAATMSIWPTGGLLLPGLVRWTRRREQGAFLCAAGQAPFRASTSAIIDHYSEQFAALNKIEYGIATAQLTNRGLATTSAVLSYAGKPFTTLIGWPHKDGIWLARSEVPQVLD